MYSRPPASALEPFIECVWFNPGQTRGLSVRERVLPTGQAHIAIRPSGPGFRFFEHAADPAGRDMGRAIAGGMRSTPYFKDSSAETPSFGALMRPGAAGLVLDKPAGMLAERHLPLSVFWPEQDLARLEDAMRAAACAEDALQALETQLQKRVRGHDGIAPGVTTALQAIARGKSIGDLVHQSGVSHRHFVSLFRNAVGLSPKLYSRVVRLGHVVRALHPEEAPDWAGLAADAGYFDQSHFIRDFRAHTGLAPAAYHRRLSDRAFHVAD